MSNRSIQVQSCSSLAVVGPPKACPTSAACVIVPIKLFDQICLRCSSGSSNGQDRGRPVSAAVRCCPQLSVRRVSAT